VCALVAVLAPYLACIAIARGLEADSLRTANLQPSITVTGVQFGREVPLPLKVIETLRAFKEVQSVTPRIIGTVTLGKDRIEAVVVGVPVEQLVEWREYVNGELPQNDGTHQLVIGPRIAKELALATGSPVLPFYRNDRRGERLSQVVGVFRDDAPVAFANCVLTTFETAQILFDQENLATELRVDCAPDNVTGLARALHNRTLPDTDATNPIRLRVTTREDTRLLQPREARRVNATITLLFVPVFAVAILVLIVASGVGLVDRRREVAILKATGWQTDEILLRAGVESVLLSVIAACVSLAIAWFWLSVCNGVGLAALLLSPGVRVPYRFAAVPVLVAFTLSAAIVLSGTLFASWRAAVVSPREAMR
jgi:ABC-type lipoprotein release transport system permease subunit